jgi:hypothetical protein
MSHRTPERSLWDLISKRYPAPPYTTEKVPEAPAPPSPDTSRTVPPEPGTGTDEGLLAEVQRLFDAEVVECLPREEGERQWQERLKGATPAQAYLFPWPDSLPRLGPRAVGPFTPCGDCGTGTWATYGGLSLCLGCARRRAG